MPKRNKKAIGVDGRLEVQFYTKYRFPQEEEDGVEYKRCELRGRLISTGVIDRVPEHEELQQEILQ